MMTSNHLAARGRIQRTASCTRLVAAALALAVTTVSPAAASVLPPGSSGLPFTPFPPIAATQGTLLASAYSQGDASTFRSGVLSAVYRNTLGTLDFHYQSFHLGAGPAGNDEIINATIRDFAGFSVEFFGMALDPDGAGPFVPVNNPPTGGNTSRAGRSADGSQIEVDFWAAGFNGLLEGENTATWIIRTDALAYRRGSFSLIAGDNVDDDPEFRTFGFAPAQVPTPASVTLFGLVLGGLALVRPRVR